MIMKQSNMIYISDNYKYIYGTYALNVIKRDNDMSSILVERCQLPEILAEIYYPHYILYTARQCRRVYRNVKSLR